MLLTPGNQAARLDKAVQLDVDAVVFDLEDGVAPGEKAAARETVNEALAGLDFGHRERLVRVNAIGTDDYERDMQAITFAHIDGLFVPKVESATEL